MKEFKKKSLSSAIMRRFAGNVALVFGDEEETVQETGMKQVTGSVVGP
jgi:hypothetical protein